MEGEFYHSVSSSASVNSSLWSIKAKSVKIVQATDNGIKFTLPSEFTSGIYAVRLYGYDNLSDNDDIVIYLNTPHIEGATGDEGEIATHGGYIQFTGEMLALDAPTEDGNYVETASEKVKIRLKNESGEYSIDTTILSPYSIKGEIGYDIPYGTYEAVIYNGYGDDTCWSQPYTVKIGIGVRDTWPKTVFNIKDFGATGDKEQNATPYFVNVLTAAQQNGGGIIYLPKGIYNLFHSVIIPENVKLIGDSCSESIVFWSPDQWNIGKLLSYQIGITNNVEIKNIGFYGTRMGNLFKFFGEESENIYFENLLVYVNPYSGSPTDTGGAILESEIYNKIMYETKKYSPFVWCNEDCWNVTANLHIDNVNFENTTDFAMRRMTDLRNCKYAKVTNNSFRAAWSLLWGSNTIWMNNLTDASTLAILGHNVYFSNSRLQNRIDNNRELFVADWSAGSFSGAVDATLKPVEGSGGLKFTISKFYADGFLSRGYQIYVTSGQGRGQTRIVVNNVGNTIEIDSPFVISPNSNSKVTIRVTRQNNFFVDNYYFNGSAGGYFGGYANVVYDSNTHQRHSAFYQNSRSNDNNWYTAYVNETYFDPYVFYKYGSENSNTDNVNGGDNSGYGFISLISQNFGGSMVHLFRNNTYDGYKITFNTSLNNAISDVVIEKNSFENVDVAIDNSTAQNNVLNGIIYRKNYLFDVNKFVYSTSNSLTNTQGYLKQIFEEDSSYSDSASLIGDVNGDGKISVKDITLIKYYFAEIYSLTQEQLKRADMNGDGKVGLTDVSEIRKYIFTN